MHANHGGRIDCSFFVSAYVCLIIRNKYERCSAEPLTCGVISRIGLRQKLSRWRKIRNKLSYLVLLPALFTDGSVARYAWMAADTERMEHLDANWGGDDIACEITRTRSGSSVDLAGRC
jgi:hypothetical protein